MKELVGTQAVDSLTAYHTKRERPYLGSNSDQKNTQGKMNVPFNEFKCEKRETTTPCKHFELLRGSKELGYI